MISLLTAVAWLIAWIAVGLIALLLADGSDAHYGFTDRIKPRHRWAAVLFWPVVLALLLLRGRA